MKKSNLHDINKWNENLQHNDVRIVSVKEYQIVKCRKLTNLWDNEIWCFIDIRHLVFHRTIESAEPKKIHTLRKNLWNKRIYDRHKKSNQTYE